MNALLSVCTGFFSALLWIKLAAIPTLDYAIVMKIAVVPAFLLGVLSNRRLGYLLIAPAINCFCILLPPWLHTLGPRPVDGGQAFFWLLIFVPGYFLLYLGAAALGYLSKRYWRQSRCA